MYEELAALHLEISIVYHPQQVCQFYAMNPTLSMSGA